MLSTWIGLQKGRVDYYDDDDYVGQKEDGFNKGWVHPIQYLLIRSTLMISDFDFNYSLLVLSAHHKLPIENDPS